MKFVYIVSSEKNMYMQKEFFNENEKKMLK